MTLRDVIEAHEQALRFGGRPGVLDWNLIKSAIGRPYTGYYRAIYRKAAALVESLAGNHGFVDGNKRTAFLVLDLFLARSGYRLHDPDGTSDRAVERLILQVVSKRISRDELVNWFSRRIRAGKG